MPVAGRLRRRADPPEPNEHPERAVAEDRREPPFEGGSQPVPHQKDPVPGPGRGAGAVLTLVIAALVLAAVAVYALGRL
jgi:uncharacterized protein HemX